MSQAPSSPIPAVGVICLRGNDVLLIKRGTPPRQGEWSIPGGKVEPGETFEQAALRELTEETGVQAQLTGKIAVIDADFGTHHYLLHDYSARWISGEPCAADDAAAARFVSREDLAGLPMWEQTRSVIEKTFQLSAETDD